MWKKIKIEDEDFFIFCSIEADEKIKCMLYNLKQSWSSEISLEEAAQTTKTLNKRIQYTAETMRETLLQATPEECAWELCDNSAESRLLKLKYRVSSRPFNFEWRLRAQNQEEHNESMTLPFLKALHGMTMQIEQLRAVVRKKDIEIGQYKTEGALLRRTTVSTQPFDSAAFDAKFAETQALTASLLAVTQHVQKHFGQMPAQPKAALETKAEDSSTTVKSETKPKAESPQAIKEKLKKKKRRAIEMQQQQMARKLQAQKQKLVYENSQSQSQSSTDAGDEPAVAVTAPLPAAELDDDDEEDDLLAFSTRLDAKPQDKRSQELLAIQKALQNLEEQRIADMKRRSQDGDALPGGSNKHAKLSRY